ncbi:MAG TPA: hypothetical protein DIV54_09345 [Verrucomicrobiales bacterium]|nr:hypothetical protein [Verrucomicrobiales bacterium]
MRLLAPGIILLSLLAQGEEEKAGLDWWSLQVVDRPPVPALQGQDGLAQIDAFVRERLVKNGLVPASRADPGVLIRRLHHDLTGIPPTAQEVSSFVSKQSEGAYAELVDELLSSNLFGERWARHWLDVVRYAETNGYERDAVKLNIWKYRDWVIGALNQDMPYDQFVREQLAGDEIAERTDRSVIATGMLRAGTWNDEPNDPQEYMYERLEDMVDVVSTAFLGITVRCARCHDHKFDPIPQRDYYRLAAAFWPGAIEPRDGALMGGPSEEELGVKAVFGWTDVRKNPAPLHLLENGEPHRKAEVVEPGFLSLVPALDMPMDPPRPGWKTTRRRAQLAEFIVDRRNPLTARVMVNRIWQVLFGHGIVRTPNNFGRKAAPPSHPELLDWLAAEFMENGWKIKPLIRKIVLSEAYRQSSLHPEEEGYARIDAANTSLWRQNRRRMDAEALRDSMLTVSGELNLKMGGPSFYPVMPPEALEGFSRKGKAWKASPQRERNRRSIYMLSKRHLLLPLMTAFDFPNSEKPCGRRDVTTVAPQALAMLNNRFVHDRSERLAGRIAAKGMNGKEAIQEAWRLVLARDPRGAELDMALSHYAKQKGRFQRAEGSEPDPSGIPRQGLSLWLTADRGLEVDSKGSVVKWMDESGEEHHAYQDESRCRPRLSRDAVGGRPALRFSGEQEYLLLKGEVVSSQANTIIAVARDRSGLVSHRGIFSNWDGRAGNSTTSLFLGLTGEGTVRFSDDYRSEGKIERPGEPFVLAVSTGSKGSVILHNGAVIGSRSSALSRRKLEGSYVIGQQGNIDGEYWAGDIAEIMVYNRQLSAEELRRLGNLLAEKYSVPFSGQGSLWDPSPELLSLASVCHVLLNTNEFLYVD